MDRIILEVDDIAIKKWRYFSKDTKDELTSTFNQLVKKADDNSKADFKALLDDIGREAESNGLTEEILNKLLREE